MKKKKCVILTIVLLLVGWIAFCGFQWSWGPFDFLHNIKTSKLPVNATEYDLEYAGTVENSVLQGKTICFLGSSVTKGAASGDVSFVDYIGQRNQCTVVKEAVKTNKEDQGSRIFDDIAEQIDEKLSERNISKSEVAGIGIGVPGPVKADGTVVKCVNVGWGILNVEQELA